MSTSGKELVIITSRENRQFALLDRIMEEKRTNCQYWAQRSAIRNLFLSGIRRGSIEYFIGERNPDRDSAYYRVFDNEVMIGCCSFTGENLSKLREWATGKTNKNEENDKMITVKNDCNETFALGATEMKQTPHGYKMSRLTLKAAMESKPRIVAYGFTGALNETHMTHFVDNDDHIGIGCCDFYGDEAHKLRKWAMGGKNGSVGTRKRIGKGKNSNRKAAPRTARNTSAARSNKARPRKKAVAGRTKRRRTAAR